MSRLLRKEVLESMSGDDVHELMQTWMDASRLAQEDSLMNRAPKLLRRQWRMGQLKKQKRDQKQKTRRAAKDDMDDLLKRASTENEASGQRSWRCKLHVHMHLVSFRGAVRNCFIFV